MTGASVRVSFFRWLTVDRNPWELPVAAVIVGLITIAFASGAYFYGDDLVFAEYFTLNPVTLDAFTRSWFGHLMPGYIACVVLFLKVFGLSWPAALVIMAIIHAGAFVAIVRCLDAVLQTKARTSIVVALAFTLSLGTMSVRLWWAATLNNMMALALGLAVLGCATRWALTRRRRHLVAALGLYGFALACSEKNLLFSLHIALWMLFVVWRGRPVRSRMVAVRETWQLWAGLAILSLIDVVAFVTGSYTDESGVAPSLASSAKFIAHIIFGALVPSLFGLDMVDQPTSLLEPRVLASMALLLAFVVWTIVVVRTNAGVWTFAALTVLANAAVLSRRADLIGIEAGRQLRYLLESSALLWLALGVILFTLVRSLLARGSGAAAGGIVAGVVGRCVAIAIAAAAAWSWAGTLSGYLATSSGHAARAWLENLEATLPRDEISVVDAPLPESFALSGLHPYDMLGPLLPWLGWHRTAVTDELDDDAWFVNVDGFAGPARMGSVEEQFSGTRCTDGSAAISLPELSKPRRDFLIIDYSKSAGSSLAVLFDGGWSVVDRREGSGRIVVYLPAEHDGDISIDGQGAGVCIDRVSVGSLEAAR